MSLTNDSELTPFHISLIREVAGLSAQVNELAVATRTGTEERKNLWVEVRTLGVEMQKFVNKMSDVQNILLEIKPIVAALRDARLLTDTKIGRIEPIVETLEKAHVRTEGVGLFAAWAWRVGIAVGGATMGYLTAKHGP